ncbi:MAG: T9SS type A sorting domain-containing protein [Bacteroidales bacterium]|nr:T9SS type A sorting domain-containing protein [Bacteroidales bacterium]
MEIIKSILTVIVLCFVLNVFTQTIPYAVTPGWESTPNGHIATGLCLTDINGDGWKDLVVGNGNDIQRQHLVVYYNNGDGTFPLTPDWESDDIDYHGHVAVGDINLDGWIDVAVSVYLGENGFGDPGKVKVYYNLEGELEGTPSFESYSFYTFSCALGDADGDGDLDLATTNAEPYGAIYDEGNIFLNRNGIFDENPEWISNIPIGSMDVEFADVDQNGFLDVIYISQVTDNFIFLSDNSGIIPSTPSWQSEESSNYMNSIDFGFTGSDKIPGIVMTGNNQLGGDGKVRLYSFDNGVPATSSASWTSNTFGYGSGILLSDVDVDGILDVIYGGWWLPVKIALGNDTGFEMNPSYTSGTNSVVEAIQIADLDRDGIETTTEIINITESVSVIYLEKQLIENILSVRINGKNITLAFYCTVPNKNWISFKDNLLPGDEVTVEYEFSHDGEMVITNWDSQIGNYIFYNDPQTSEIKEQRDDTRDISINVFPNPVDDKLTITYFSPSKQLIEIYLTDLLGKKHYHTHREWIKKGVNTIELSTVELSAGVYQIEFKASNYREVRKIIK